MTTENKEINDILQETVDNVQYFQNTVDGIVKEHSEALDGLMSDIYVECIQNGDASIETLGKYYLELTNMIYFMASKVEKAGAYADLSKSAAKETYSRNYLDSQVRDEVTGKNRFTVAELQATAELATQKHNVVSDIYGYAYRVVKEKVNSAKDMVSTLRRLISTKTEEMKLSSYSPNQNMSGFTGE